MKKNELKLAASIRRGLCVILAFGIVLGGFGFGTTLWAQDENAEVDKDLRVVSWNIQWFPGKKTFARGKEMHEHVEIVTKELKKINPSILMAQEIRDWESFAILCKAIPGMRSAVVSAFPSRRTGEYWRQQTAIGSILPVVAAWTQPWEARNELQPPRGFAAAVLRLPGGGKPRHLLVYSLHLKSNLSKSEEETLLNYRDRDESVQQLLEHVREMTEKVFKDSIVGVIVGGDMNTNQDGQFGDNVIKLFKDAGYHHSWAGVAREQRATWRGGDKFDPVTFDHIFTLGLGKPKARLIEAQEATSDHRPMEIVIPEDVLAAAKPIGAVVAKEEKK